jgi:enamine deaminase RidA (YjgF/YER057c/UK114 family)
VPQNPEALLRELGHELPAIPEPSGAYAPTTRTGSLVFTAGQLPFEEGELYTTGKVGDAVTLEEFKGAAWPCVLNALAAAAAEAGGLNGLGQFVKLTGYVASAADFNRRPEVMNGVSELIGQVFGDAGLHAHSAVGVAELLLDAPVEVGLVVELGDS